MDHPAVEDRSFVVKGFPQLTEDQQTKAKKSFVKSIDLDAVCALASRFNGGIPCRIVGRANGGFNVCFFVAFARDGDRCKWVVRVPFAPALDSPWEKVLSEVATMRYVQQNTNIPVPRVHAYGRDAKLAKTGTGDYVYLIMDYVEGAKLDRNLFFAADEELRRGFYAQLIDVLAALRQLAFPQIGSLMPDPAGSQQPPVLGPVLTMSAATLQRPPPPAAFASAREYMRYQFGLVTAFFQSPISDHEIDDIREEVFALHHLERELPLVIDPELDAGPFVLNHLDLRGHNIVVDEDLRIRGIIDWEFATTVPRQLVTPPSWITGHDSVDTSQVMHAEFRAVLRAKSSTDALCRQLEVEWYGQGGDNIGGQPAESRQTRWRFCMAHVLRRPTDAANVFVEFLEEPCSSEMEREDRLFEFFQTHPELEVEAQARAAQCQRYSRYLEENGLFETTATD